VRASELDQTLGRTLGPQLRSEERCRGSLRLTVELGSSPQRTMIHIRAAPSFAPRGAGIVREFDSRSRVLRSGRPPRSEERLSLPRRWAWGRTERRRVPSVASGAPESATVGLEPPSVGLGPPRSAFPGLERAS
jgi:hypothetical protein